MQNVGIALGCPSADFLRKVEVSFQQFYSSIATLPCSNNLKFWLACEGLCRYGSKGYSMLSRALYNDFLRPSAPFKVAMNETIVHLIRCQLVHADSSPSLHQLLQTAQKEVGELLGSGNCDLKFIFHLVVNYKLMESCQLQSPVSWASGTKYSMPANEPAKLRCYKPKQEHYEAKNLSFRFSATASKQSISSKLLPPETFFLNVHSRLITVQKERDTMLKKAKEEAIQKGEGSDKVDWYDFSGCPKKYR